MTDVLPGVLAGHRVVAIIRLPAADHLVRVGEELAAAGIAAIEVTLTSPGALAAITALRSALPGASIGAGSVRNPDDARRCVEAGAQFLVTPTTQLAVLAAATVPTVCGAFTPTEIDTAWQAGAAFVKLFPAGTLGPRYLRDVLAPLPDVPIVPTGGVTPATVADWAAAGAVAVGAGSALVDPATVAAQDWPALRAAAATWTAAASTAW